jgi:hypothetical protein
MARSIRKLRTLKAQRNVASTYTDTLGKGTGIRGLRTDLKARLVAGEATLISKVAISLLTEVNARVGIHNLVHPSQTKRLVGELGQTAGILVMDKGGLRLKMGRQLIDILRKNSITTAALTRNNHDEAEGKEKLKVKDGRSVARRKRVRIRKLSAYGCENFFLIPQGSGLVPHPGTPRPLTNNSPK